ATPNIPGGAAAAGPRWTVPRGDRPPAGHLPTDREEIPVSRRRQVQSGGRRVSAMEDGSIKTSQAAELRIMQDASEWILRLEESDTPQCHADFAAWLKHSPRHLDEFLTTAALYQSLHRIDPTRRIDVTKLLHAQESNVVSLRDEPDQVSPE